jgi:hypothetical protein
MAERGERHTGSGDQKTESRDAISKLKDLGVAATQSSRWQQLAALPQDAREERIERAKHKAVSAIDGTKPPRGTAGTAITSGTPRSDTSTRRAMSWARSTLIRQPARSLSPESEPPHFSRKRMTA